LIVLPPVPDLPPATLVELPGRGRTYVADTGPPPRRPNAPTVFLLHALACTGLLTWYPCLDALRARYRVVLFDQRWHGQGIRTARFDLADCADDVAAVADALDIDTFVAAGYSMGSLVAPLAWRRHPDRVRGLVLCASATNFAETPRRQRSVRAVSLRLAGSAERQRDALSSPSWTKRRPMLGSQASPRSTPGTRRACSTPRRSGRRCWLLALR
jgi:pimeloyl-ACP methyl ester carboxylesterase